MIRRWLLIENFFLFEIGEVDCFQTDILPRRWDVLGLGCFVGEPSRFLHFIIEGAVEERRIGAIPNISPLTHS